MFMFSACFIYFGSSSTLACCYILFTGVCAKPCFFPVHVETVTFTVTVMIPVKHLKESEHLVFLRDAVSIHIQGCN